MEDLIRFLKQNFKDFARQDEEREFTGGQKDYLEKLNTAFKSQDREEAPKSRFKRYSSPDLYQIWSIKDSYIDFRGLEQSASHPFLVIIISDVKELEGEPFVRVHVVSPFIQLAAADDTICADPTVIGFPFLIEAWNEQPVLVELLDEYVGSYPYKVEKKSDHIHLLKWQAAFRTEEVSKARYLNNSLSSLLFFLEHQQTSKGGVVVSMADRIYLPQLYQEGEERERPLNLAAKSGTANEDQVFGLQTPELPFQLSLRDTPDGFVLWATPRFELQLFDASNTEISGVLSTDKIIFLNLKKGAYKLIGPSLPNPLKLRIK